MGNSSTLLDTIATNQSNKEVVVNALMDAASPAMLWGRHASACSGLIWGFYGGQYIANAIANGTLTLTPSATNYVYADNVTGAMSVNTAGVPAGKIPVYVIVAGATTVSNYIDLRSYQLAGIPPSGVTSVALAAPAEFTVAGSPITAAGTLTLTKAAQAINQVWAGPASGGSGVPAFRALVVADLPTIVLDSLSDVQVTAPADGDLLRYNATLGQWKNTQIYPAHNRAINGNCLVAQRPSFVASTGLSGFGGPDRYFANNALSAGGQFTQSAGTITYGGVAKAAVVQTVNTAIALMTSTNVWQGIQQRFEGFNVFDLLGNPVALAFIFSTNVTGTYSLGVRDSTAANSFVSSFAAVAGTPLKVIIPIAALSTALVIPNTSALGLTVSVGALNQATYQTATLNAWQAGNFMTASGAVNWGATAANFIAMTELQVEPGLIANPFEREIYSVTFGKCQRYYQTVLANFYGYNVAAGTIGALFPFSVPMRITPVPTLLAAGSVVNCAAPTCGITAFGYQPFAAVTAAGAASFVNYSFGLNSEI